MWSLLYIVLVINPTTLTVSESEGEMFKLETFATSEECQIERNRIGYEMAAAYPYERDFVIECRPVPHQTLKASHNDS